MTGAPKKGGQALVRCRYDSRDCENGVIELQLGVQRLQLQTLMMTLFGI